MNSGDFLDAYEVLVMRDESMFDSYFRDPLV